MPDDVAVLAYAAGLLDGEGNVSIRNAPKAGTDLRYHQACVRITSVDTAVMDWLVEHFGGSVAGTPPKPPSRLYSYRWLASSRLAPAFVKAVRPYLIIKARQADLVLALAATKVRDGSGTRPWVTEEIYREREVLRQQILFLNRRGPLAA